MKHCKEVKIGELAHLLEVEPFVIRFWEKEFQLAAHRTPGGQRVYTNQHVTQFKKIKQLLYKEGFTIAGAKKMLDQGVHLRTKETLKATSQTSEVAASPQAIVHQLKELHKRLCALYKKL